METTQLYNLIRAAAEELRKEEDEEILELEPELQRDKKLHEYGFDTFSLGALQRDLEQRLDGRTLKLESFMVPEHFYDITMGQLVDHIAGKTHPATANPIVVYVDDEEENLFIFKRKFGKAFNLKTFAAPTDALEFIKGSNDVALVITDEVMPGMTGNQLCDEVKKLKPFMKFILITGNPENDDQLMYKSLRHSRFYEFIQKPVDFDGHHEDYLKLISSLVKQSE